MHQTKKGDQWYFGMKAHIGVDAETGLAHSLETTAANVSDVATALAVLHGDAGYQGVGKRAENRGRGVAWETAMKPGKNAGGWTSRIPRRRRRSARLRCAPRSSIRSDA